MKLPAFAYHRAQSLADAAAVLAEHGGEARVLGGGQSLLPVMALRMSHPETLVDVTAAPDLQAHEVAEISGGGAAVHVRAAVTTRTLETDPAVVQAHPLLAACLAEIGHVEIRTRGTVCGSLAHADPAAELPALLLATDGTLDLVSTRGSRRVPAADFVLGPYMTAIGDDELVAGAELPCPAPAAGWSVREIARRRGDFALAGVIAVLETDADGTDAGGRCTAARVALFGVAATAVRAGATEDVLLGSDLDDAALDEAAHRAFDGVDVLGDLHGSAEYRRRAGTRLVARALREARDRIGQGTPRHPMKEAARA